MPHFIIEHSTDDRLSAHAGEMVDTVFDTATKSGLFDPEAIKVRTRACPVTRIGASQGSFIHVAIRIMPGRADAQKMSLAQAVVDTLSALDCGANSITAEVCDIEAAAYAKHLS